MTELDAALVRRKLATIARNITDLAAIENVSLEQYREDRFRHKGTERLLQETVEAAVDVNLHVLRAEGREAPPDYYDRFVQMGRAGVLDGALAAGLAPAAGMRNRLVHEYDEIDDTIVLRAIGEARRLFAAYVAAVERHLTSRAR